MSVVRKPWSWESDFEALVDWVGGVRVRVLHRRAGAGPRHQAGARPAATRISGCRASGGAVSRASAALVSPASATAVSRCHTASAPVRPTCAALVSRAYNNGVRPDTTTRAHACPRRASPASAARR